MTRCLLFVSLLSLVISPLPAQEKKKTEDNKETPPAAKEKAQTKTDKEKEPPVKTRIVKARALELVVPEIWKDKKTQSRMRAATLEVPPVKGDKEKGELAVFVFPPQSIDDNITRWVNQFKSEGRKQKITKGKTKKKVDYYFVEVSGTYRKPDGPPFLQKTIDAPGYRMLAAILPVKGQGVYFLKLTGQDKTVAAQTKAMRKAFGGEIKTEKSYKTKSAGR